MNRKEKRTFIVIAAISVVAAVLYLVLKSRKPNTEYLPAEASLMDMSQFAAFQQTNTVEQPFDRDAVVTSGEIAKQLQSDLNSIILFLKSNMVATQHFHVDGLLQRHKTIKEWTPLEIDGVVGTKTKKLTKYVTGESLTTLNKVLERSKGWIYYTSSNTAAVNPTQGAVNTSVWNQIFPNIFGFEKW